MAAVAHFGYWGCPLRCHKKAPRIFWTGKHRKQVWNKTNGCCCYCSEELDYNSSWHVEHFVALATCPSHEENDRLSNLFACCAPCNQKGHHKYDLVAVINQPERWPKGIKIHPAIDIHLTGTHAKDRLQEAISVTKENEILNNIPGLLRIPESALTLAAKKGMSGSYGIVHHYLWVSHNGAPVVDVAIKVWSPVMPASHRRLLREITTLQSCEHPNIVKLLGYTHIQGKLGMVLEWAPDTLAMPTLPANSNIFIFAMDLLQALSYLHRRGIAHRDIKPHNVLIKTLNNLPRTVLCDFGVCSDELDDDTAMKTDVGTSLYKCPAVRSNNYTKKVDYYSWARTIYDTEHTHQKVYTSITPATYSKLREFLLNVWEKPTSFKLPDIIDQLRALSPVVLEYPDPDYNKISSRLQGLNLGPKAASSSGGGLLSYPKNPQPVPASSIFRFGQAPPKVPPAPQPVNDFFAPTSYGTPQQRVSPGVSGNQAAPSLAILPNSSRSVIGFVTTPNAKTYHTREGCYRAYTPIYSVDKYQLCGICQAQDSSDEDNDEYWVTSSSSKTYHTTYGCYNAKKRIEVTGSRNICSACESRS